MNSDEKSINNFPKLLINDSCQFIYSLNIDNQYDNNYNEMNISIDSNRKTWTIVIERHLKASIQRKFIFQSNFKCTEYI
jgi:hypothetical protein